MRSPAATNRRRSLRNRRNRQPATPPNPHRVPVVYSPKLKYENSTRRADGVLILSTRKRAPPTAEELEERKRKKLAIKTAHVAKTALQHTVLNMYKYGAFNDTCQFAAKKPKSIIQFLQLTYPEKYGNFHTAKSFFITQLKLQKPLQLPRI